MFFLLSLDCIFKANESRRSNLSRNGLVSQSRMFQVGLSRLGRLGCFGWLENRQVSGIQLIFDTFDTKKNGMLRPAEAAVCSIRLEAIASGLEAVASKSYW